MVNIDLTLLKTLYGPLNRKLDGLGYYDITR